MVKGCSIPVYTGVAIGATARKPGRDMVWICGLLVVSDVTTIAVA
jgi:hypothetical protein